MGALIEVKPLGELRELVEGFVVSSRAKNSIRAYRSDWADFVEFCEQHREVALGASAGTVAAYIASLADSNRHATTIQRRLSSISQAHTYAGLESPVRDAGVRAVMAGIRRTLGVTPRKQALPLSWKEVCRMSDHAGEGLLGIRNRALILIGFPGGFRRSELAELQLGAVEFVADGVVVTIAKSKTDQEGEGREVGIPRSRHHCPVMALRTWIEAAEITSGFVYRRVDNGGIGARLSDKSVALAVQACAKRAGLDVERISGHSLRAGLATSASNAGASIGAVMRQGGWKSEAMARRYIRPDLFTDNAAAKVFER